MEEGHSLGALASLVDVPDYAPQYAKDNWRNYTKECDGDPNRFTAYGQYRVLKDRGWGILRQL